MTNVDVVLIGRNEGARLVASLQSAQGQARQLVYVDSGSTDDSIDEARKAGAQIVELDMSTPFSAARARNAGFDALDNPELVMFIDGDCMLVEGFLDKACAHLDANPKIALVTGWRSEIHRNESLYNQLIDWEWRRPAGVILACGGDMLVRASAWREIGGMDPTVIASEDEEFCTRLRKAGWTLERIPQEMTRHDANMMTFEQWWSRAVRTGHGFAQVGSLHPEYFAAERKRALLYGLALPVLILLSALIKWWLPLIFFGLYELSYIRTAIGLSRAGMANNEIWRHAWLLTLSKFPNALGMARFHFRRLRGDEMRIIEYK